MTAALRRVGWSVSHNIELVLFFADLLQASKKIIGIHDDEAASAGSQRIQNLLVGGRTGRKLRNQHSSLVVGIIGIRLAGYVTRSTRGASAGTSTSTPGTAGRTTTTSTTGSPGGPSAALTTTRSSSAPAGSTMTSSAASCASPATASAAGMLRDERSPESSEAAIVKRGRAKMRRHRASIGGQRRGRGLQGCPGDQTAHIDRVYRDIRLIARVYGGGQLRSVFIRK